MSLVAHLLVNELGVPRNIIERGVRETVIYGGSLLTYLLELQLVPEETLLAALAKRYGVPAFDLRDLQIVSRAASLVPAEMLVKHNVLPLRVHGKTLDLAMVDPRRRMAVADIASATSLLVKPFVVLESRLQALLEPFGSMGKVPSVATDHPKRVFATASETQKTLRSATERDQVGDALLSLALRYFARVIVFVHRKDLLMSWRHGTRATKIDAPDKVFHPPALELLHLPLNQASVFRTVVDTGAPAIGKLTAGKVHDYFYQSLAGGAANISDRPSALVAPVAVFGRVVNVLYGDAAGYLPSQSQRADLMVALAEAGDAYERMVRDRISTA